MRVQDFVKKNVRTIGREASIQEVARLMADEDIGFLPVVDSSGKPVGTITDRDIVVRLIAKGGDLKGARVEQAMTKDVARRFEPPSSRELRTGRSKPWAFRSRSSRCAPM